MKAALLTGAEVASGSPGLARRKDPLETSFVGREREIALLVEMLSRPEPRLIVLTGLSGVGKTRLAAEICSVVERQLGSLVLFLPLASLEHASDIPRLVDSALVAATLEDAATLSPRCRLSAAEVLVVLDNVEHLPGAGQQVLEMLAGRQDVRVLVTSTSPLRLPGEQVLRLEPLSPPRTGELDPADLLDVPAVRLFADRAAAADASFSVTEDNVEVVAELCGILGGLPLAIELAAARVATLAPAQLLAQLGDPTGLDLLTGTSGESGRQDSMRGALTWTATLLSEPARRLLASLSMFEGSFSQEGLSALDDQGREASKSFDALCELVEVRLVEPAITQGAARFTLPPLVRSFTRLALMGGADFREAEARHTAFVISLGQRAGQSFERGDQADAFALLSPEWAEVTIVLDRLVRQGRTEEALQLSVDCAPFLLAVRYDGGARARLERLIEAARSLVPNAEDGTLARALLWSTLLARQAPDASLHAGWGATRLAEGLEMARRVGDGDAVLLGLELTALATPLTGDLEAAGRALEEGWKMAAESAHEGRLARFEALSAMLAQLEGDDAGALAWGTAALLRARRRDDPQGTVLASLLLLSLPEDLRLPPMPSLEDLLGMCQSIHYHQGASYLLSVCAFRHLQAGDLVESARLCCEHLNLVRRLGGEGTINSALSIMSLTVLASRSEEPEIAAALHGGIARLLEVLSRSVSPMMFEEYLAGIDRARERLGKERFAQAAAQPMDLHAALDYARQLTKGLETTRIEPGDRPTLSPRELEILLLLATGLTNKAIAAQLQLSPKTVMHYLGHLYRKLDVSGRLEAVAWAYQNGLIVKTV